MGPEESMHIQSNLASTIAMAFDECIENPAEYNYVKKSVARTTRWLRRCKREMSLLNSRDCLLYTSPQKQEAVYAVSSHLRGYGHDVLCGFLSQRMSGARGNERRYDQIGRASCRERV